VRKRVALPLAGLCLFVGVGIGAAGDRSPEPLDPVQGSVTSTKPPAGIEDGTWEIGSDIVAGKYKSTGGDTCYWARLKSLNGGVGSILANGIAPGPQTVVIAPGDAAFTTARCGTWYRQ
jgi:hypothetical protein